MVQLLWKTVGWFLTPLNTELPENPAISLLGKRRESRDSGPYLYTRVHSNIIHCSWNVETTQTFKRPFIDEGINRMLCRQCDVAWVCAQSCPTLCDPMDCSPPGFSVNGILPARILEWVTIFSSRGSSQSRDWTHVSRISCTVGGFFTAEPPGKPHNVILLSFKRDGNSDMCYNMNELLGHSAQWKKPVTKRQYCRIPLMWGTWKSQIHKMVVTRGWGAEQDGESLLNECRVPVLQDEDVLEVDGGDGHKMWTHLATLTWAPRND